MGKLSPEREQDQSGHVGPNKQFSSNRCWENERVNSSQDNTSRNHGNKSNENGKHKNRGKKIIWNANSISPNFRFEGAKPELGGVLTLRTEKVKNKLLYQL